jgi:S-formylglutathione hydrolase
MNLALEIPIPAPSLGNNILGDTSTQTIALIVPSSYNSSDRTYPVIYFLHGFGERIADWEPLFSRMGLNDTIIVLVPGHNILGGSFYANSPVIGNWEDFIVNDLVHYVEAHFRIANDSVFRGIAGFSMGGYGALNIAMKHSDLFGSVYAISPGLFDRNGLANSQISWPSVVEEYLRTQTSLSTLNKTAAHEKYLTMMSSLSGWRTENELFTFAYGSAFSPNPTKNAPYIDYLYYTDESGKIVLNSTAEANWYSGFGAIDEKVEKYKGNLKSLREIGIEYGALDSYTWIPQGCEYLSQRLSSENINYVLTKTNYGHGDSMNQRISQEMLPFFERIFRTPIQTEPGTTITIQTQNQNSTFYLAIPFILAFVVIATVVLLRNRRRTYIRSKDKG